MSGLLGKVTDQLSGQQSSQYSSGSSGLMHKVTDAITGQKHPQDSRNYSQMYENSRSARPYVSEAGYQSGQFIHPEAQGHFEPRYGDGHGNYSAPSGSFGGHNNGRGFYPNAYNNGYSGGYEAHGGSASYGREYPSHQAGYGRHNAADGRGNASERRWEYSEGGHNSPGSYESHGGQSGHNDPLSHGGGHDMGSGPYNTHGQGGYGGGHSQYGGAHHGAH